MAAASPSPLASSVEKTNGAKLSRLLIDGGTTVLRQEFDRRHPPANLSAGLNANYSTLSNLLKKKVLRAAQWDKLFPPCGSAPDSNTFDITLLFLLLTNICGLSPPLSGWHTKPPPSDISLEANLARVKFFRNALYGHVSTTGIDTPTFSCLWQEISAVLVALGLDQVEIDRLKAEHCGEEDYLDVLREWAVSEEDIKSQLTDIQRSQTKTQETVGIVRQTQILEQKILEDTKSKLNEMHQLQLEEHKTMGELHHSEIKTQQSVHEVRQTQLEDHKTLENSKSKLDEMHQYQMKTEHVIGQIRQTQLEDHKRLEEVHQAQLNTRQALDTTIQGANSKVEKVLQIQEDHESLELKQRRKDKEDEILKKLAKIDTENDVKYHAEWYQEGTRVSIFTKLENWLDDRGSQNRVMVISGNAGMGKSVISAVVCRRMKEAGRLSGSHFCQHDKARHRNPKVMLQSLACQLSESLEEYRNTLVEVLSRNLGVELNDMEVKELFELLLEEPLKKLKDPGRNILMVVDGLDESEYRGRNELLDVISNHFNKLPCWIRFLVTTRPEINIADSLKSFSPLTLEPDDEENLMDIRLLLKKQLSHFIQPEHEDCVITELVKKSEGLILYAYLLTRFIKDSASSITPEHLDSTFPSGISSVYETYFQRLEKELCKELNIREEQFFIFLSALVAAKEPLLLSFFTQMMVPGTTCLTKRREVKKAQACISTLLPIRGDCIHFFHKSVKDWLSGTSNYGKHDFIVDIKEGHRILCKLCTVELAQVKKKGVDRGQFSDTKKYALQYGVQHMLELEDEEKTCLFEEVVNKYVVDLELVYAKLCVNNTAASEDIVYVQKQEGFSGLSTEIALSLNTLMFLLRKHRRLLGEHPDALFQTVLNEGGPKISCEARNLLETKYCELPYMEFLNKTELQGELQAEFSCQSQVVCFDVSPQLDYMVCECREHTIELWSLLTGERQWIRPVRRIKDLDTSLRGAHSTPISSSEWSPLTRSQFDTLSFCGLSFYRSVVFHPDGNVVLPGELRQAYTIGGDLKSLFPGSQCLFTVCSISGDKTMILTDCCEDDKCIVLWSLTNGKEISRIKRKDKVLSFGWSRDGNLITVSHSTGSICVVDRMNDFNTLAETTTSNACGMVRFSPDQQSLFCLHVPLNDENHVLYHVSLRRGHHNSYSLDVSCPPVSGKFHPWNLESRSEVGFLLGDQFAHYSDIEKFNSVKWAFVLNEQSVLISSPEFNSVSLLRKPSEITNTENSSFTSIKNIVLSLNGDTVYVVRNADPVNEISAWDIKSEDLKAVKPVEDLDASSLLPVRDGVVFLTGDGCPELWNFELSKCINRWNNITGVTRLIHISEELVACVVDVVEKKDGHFLDLLYGNRGDRNLVLWDIELPECAEGQTHSTTLKRMSPLSDEQRTSGDKKNVVIILDTRSGELLSTIHIFNGRFITCNSKCQFVTTLGSSVQVVDGKASVCTHSTEVLIFTSVVHSYFVNFVPLYHLPGRFSPNGQFVIVEGSTISVSFRFLLDPVSAYREDNKAMQLSSAFLYVFDVVSLKTPYTLCESKNVRGFIFVSDELCVVSSSSSSGRTRFRLFNVKSGALLSVLEVDGEANYLAACPLRRLIAFPIQNDPPSFKVIHIKFSAKKGNGKCKR